MTLPSFDAAWRDGGRIKPRICVLEVRDRDRQQGEAIATLIVEREETYRRDPGTGTVLEASIKLSYERVAPAFSHRQTGKGVFSGGYRRGQADGAWVSLISTSTATGTAAGAVFLDLPGLEGQRIGTYLMNEVVTWATQWPDALIVPIELLAGQAHGDNKARRNRFYEQFGLEFDYTDSQHKQGLSRSKPVGAINTVDTWRSNIRERDIREFVGELMFERDQATTELAAREGTVKSLVSDIRRSQAKPFRWALLQTWSRSGSTLVHIALLTFVCVMMWWRTQSGG